MKFVGVQGCSRSLCMWVTLPCLDPLSSDTTSITWWPFVPGRGFVCVCVWQTVWCLLQDTHFAAALCPVVLPWAAHRMLSCFDALINILQTYTFCEDSQSLQLFRRSSDLLTVSGPSLLKSADVRCLYPTKLPSKITKNSFFNQR